MVIFIRLPFDKSALASPSARSSLVSLSARPPKAKRISIGERIVRASGVVLDRTQSLGQQPGISSIVSVQYEQVRGLHRQVANRCSWKLSAYRVYERFHIDPRGDTQYIGCNNPRLRSRRVT